MAEEPRAMSQISQLFCSNHRGLSYNCRVVASLVSRSPSEALAEGGGGAIA
jgi:hypothetical protein